MSTLEGVPMKAPDGLCCCCLELVYPNKSLWCSYKWLRDTEVYGDMLRECFNLEFQRRQQSQICEGCITQLRDALMFRRQVVRCQIKLNCMDTEFVKAEPTDVACDFTIQIEKMEQIVDDIRSEIHSSDDVKIDIKIPKVEEVSIEVSSEDDMRIDDMRPESDDEVEVAKVADNQPLEIIPGTASGGGQLRTLVVLQKGTKRTREIMAKKRAHMPTITIEPLKRTPKKSQAKKATPKKAPPKKAPAKKAPPKQESPKEEAEKPGNHPAQKTRPKADFCLRAEDYRIEGDTYICCHCNGKSSSKYQLRLHVKTKHYNFPRFRCVICDMGFMTAVPLLKHELETHNIDNRFHCNACESSFSSKRQMDFHVNDFHMLGEKIKCDLCDYETFSKRNIKRHKVKHTSVKQFQCKFCKKSFLWIRNLQLHERIHTGVKNQLCKECGQAFVQKASLNYHMTKYHPEVPF